jgi:hypothetical protein
MTNKIVYIFSYCLIVATIVSCSKHYRLKKNDKKYIPYKGNEILIFYSDKNREDTIFLTGVGNGSGCAGSQDPFPDKCDGISINCTRTDPNYDRYLEGKQLVEVQASQNGQSHISFDIVLRGSWFYNMDSYSLSEFEKIPNSELTIDNKTYKDVKIIEASEYAKQFENRENYAERFYWSISQGFLGLDRRDEKWRLIKKYEP